MPKKRGKKKREEMELPANSRRGLLAHSEGLSWIESAKVANLTPHAMRQWVTLQKCIGRIIQDLSLVAQLRCIAIGINKQHDILIRK